MHFEQVTYPFIGIEQQPSTCILTIYRRPNFDVVMIQNSTQEDETLAIKRLDAIATGVTRDYHLDPDRTCWLIQTPEPLNLLGEYRKIPIQIKPEGMVLENPEQRWTYLSESEVEAMIGAQIAA
ncbi:hypothetical protein [Acaryochloris sp. CCMEE 5410]|uniref:hypothetical protein n=1 Tax=Acaryochloris sp. CCMEE 5410 TaxID=310037 RepID=UPI000248428E|nr:hypothetical protein [Acaryochloris sp. CCMEE 5410]KAI9132833.1 hypothetical protein ON05_005410 [Acaryochloris sp. CCMEE 5410]